MASMYSAKVMEHFANPHNVGEIPDANGVGEVGNPKCGDIMRMYLKIENNVIVDVKFLTFGCGAHSEVRLAKRHAPPPMPEPVIDTLEDELDRF